MRRLGAGRLISHAGAEAYRLPADRAGGPASLDAQERLAHIVEQELPADDAARPDRALSETREEAAEATFLSEERQRAHKKRRGMNFSSIQAWNLIVRVHF